jgi:hypothetical protein
MSDGPAVADGVLLQNLLVDARRQEIGYRIYDDGRFERRAAGKPWASGPTLTPARLERVRNAIGEAGIDRLEARYEPTTPRNPDANTVVLHVHAVVNGAAHSVAVVQPCKVPAIDALIARVDDVLKEIW